jgi:prepilin-type N-terminal cleavage/methylation domain-containing protein
MGYSVMWIGSRQEGDRRAASLAGQLRSCPFDRWRLMMGPSQEATRHAAPISGPRSAFTLIELLVVVALVSVLVSLVLVAVQAARESARRSQCAAHVKQLSLAALAHESFHGHLPTGGWGGAWVGDADRGFGLQQPGAWAFNVLPYLELSAIHELGRDEPRPRKVTSHAGRMILSSPVFNCPSRRRTIAYPLVRPLTNRPINCAYVERAVRSDYAANCGDSAEPEISGFIGPPDEGAGDRKEFAWPDTTQFTGVSFLRSEIRLGDIYDGASYVYLLGEKHLHPDHYDTGGSHGDDWSLFAGFQDDLYRSTSPYWPPMCDSRTIDPRHPDGQFGSAHSSGWNASMCDGSVRFVSYSLDVDIHQRTGNRDDG